MKKISKILSLVLFSFTVGSYAIAEMKMGFSVGAFDTEPTAREEKFNAAAAARTESMALTVVSGSIFVEKDFGPVSIGIDLTPYDIESDTLDNARTAGNGADDQDTTDSAVQVKMEKPIMVYALVDLGDSGAYFRLGASRVDVATIETITTGSAYPDTEMYGGHAAIGMEKGFGDQGLSIRVEGGYSAYTNITVVNDQTARPTKIHTSALEGITARISFLKTF